MERNPIINSIHDFQAVEAHAITQLRLDQSSEEIFGMLRGEVDELGEAIHGKDRGEIASEIADVIIFTTRMASLYHIPLEIALSDKLNRNAHKYNPYKARRLQDEGHSPIESMGILKSQWIREDDKKFCHSCGRTI